MKKLTALFLSLLLVFALVACAGTNEPSTTASSAPEGTTEAPSDTSGETDTTAATPLKTGKVLVAYFSASGNTKRVAEEIAAATNADIFEIVPKEAYSSEDLNWRDENSRVNREHDDESLRDIALTTTTVENWDSYDTVFIGYPIWWAIAAWPVNSFVKGNDFSGKTVIPFATSASSGLGESGKLLADLAGTGDWQEGRRFASGASSSDVKDWVGELGL